MEPEPAELARSTAELAWSDLRRRTWTDLAQVRGSPAESPPRLDSHVAFSDVNHRCCELRRHLKQLITRQRTRLHHRYHHQGIDLFADHGTETSKDSGIVPSSQLAKPERGGGRSGGFLAVPRCRPGAPGAPWLPH
jgi:hypothetical protein